MPRTKSARRKVAKARPFVGNFVDRAPIADGAVARVAKELGKLEDRTVSQAEAVALCRLFVARDLFSASIAPAECLAAMESYLTVIVQANGLDDPHARVKPGVTPDAAWAALEARGCVRRLRSEHCQTDVVDGARLVALVDHLQARLSWRLLAQVRKQGQRLARHSGNRKGAADGRRRAVLAEYDRLVKADPDMSETERQVRAGEAVEPPVGDRQVRTYLKQR